MYRKEKTYGEIEDEGTKYHNEDKGIEIGNKERICLYWEKYNFSR